MTRNDSAARPRPIANFVAVGGRSCVLDQIHANTGARMMIDSGLTDWKNSGLIVTPKNDSSVRFCANEASVVAACSKIIQNSMAATNSGMYAMTRGRSASVTFGERYMTTKYAMGARNARYDIVSMKVEIPNPPET